MIIPIASDHAGFEAKQYVKQLLTDMGHMPVDYGTHSTESVDYPDYAVLVSNAVGSGEYEKGILICGSGQGVCMTANKHPEVRAALAWSPEIAEMSRLHNDANILCMPGRYLTEKQLEEIVKSWLEVAFEGGRHARRVKKIHELTKQESKKADNEEA